MEKLECVRAAACAAIMRQPDKRLMGYALHHCEEMGTWCRRIALRRSLDPDMAEAIAWLHNLYYFTTGLDQLHSVNSAEQARVILKDVHDATPEEINIVLQAVLNHEYMSDVQGPYDELIKDAHVLGDYAVPTYADDTRKPTVRVDALERLLRLVPEWKLLPPHRSQVRNVVTKSSYRALRGALAEAAQTVAQQQLNWEDASRDVLRIARYYPEEDALTTLNNNWSGAFVYHCCHEAGFYLPIRHPQVKERFTSVRAWRDFGSLLQYGYYHPLNETGFTPERGDIAIFDRLLSDKSCDHMGIIVNAGGEKLVVAEGNARGENISSIELHSRVRHVRGYIRIPDGYVYESEKATSICNVAAI